MRRPRRARPVLHIPCFRAVVFATTVSLLACSNFSSHSDGGTGGSTGTGGAGGATPGTGGGSGGNTGAGGSSGGSTGTGGKGGALGTGGQGGGATGGGGGYGTACGSAEPCSSGQLCVHPSCGGPVPFCEKVPDAGQCPSGWTYTGNCVTGGFGPGCTPPPCTPPAPFCADVPAACSGTPTCGCLPANICTQNGGSGDCQFANSTEVTCASA